MAKITLFYGPVRSGKTTRLIALVDQLKRCGSDPWVFRALGIPRDLGYLACHDPALGHRVAAIGILSLFRVLEFTPGKNQHVIIDDIQMFDLIETVEMVRRLQAHPELHLYVAGRDLDSGGGPIATVGHWVGKADEACWCVASCGQCGDAANLTATGPSHGLLIVNHDEEPRCERCFELGKVRT